AYYALLAHHWSQAAETSEAQRDDHALLKAVEFLDKAGEQASQNYANQEVIQFFTQALALDQKLAGSEVGQAAWERNLRRAHWHSRIGLAHYGLGSLPDCEHHVREALNLLGYPLPESRFQFGLSLIPQMIRQVSHRFFPKRYINTLQGRDREVAIEVSR